MRKVGVLGEYNVEQYRVGSMPEELIKLFSSMSERYPQPTEADAVYATARGLVSLIPDAGVIDQLLSLVLTPSLVRRRDEWFKDVNTPGRAGGLIM
jgi:hypothetical protein